MTGADDLITHALAYAEKGWPVFPLHTPLNGGCSCRKKDCTSIGKHPRTMNGRDDATTDTAIIRRWWAQWPEANIGVVTGEESGITSCDIDGEQGEAALEGYAMPDTAEQHTGRGRQLIFKRPVGGLASKTGVLAEVDIKADGGYIVVPPSLHRNGKIYTWELSSDPLAGQEIAEAPAWLLELAKPAAKKTTAPAIGEVMPEGARNASLTSQGGSMRRRGFSEAAILAALRVENQEKCSPPLPDAEVEGIAQSVARYEPAGTPEAGTKTDRHFKLVHASAIEARPPRWVVRDILEAEALALVFGDPGTCKSFWAMDIGLSVATGTDFHGHVIADHGPVVYVCGEGQNGIKRRLMAWSALRGVSHDSAPFFVSMSPTALVDPDALDEVLKAIDDIAASAGPPRVVIFDTLARNFGPADENSTSDMSKAISAADAIRARYRSTVLLVHHSGHADKTRARGAMSLKAALDSEYRLDKDETGTIRFEATKMKDAEHPEPMAFRLRPVDLDLIDPDTGEIITGAALELTSYEPRAAKGKQGRGKWQTRANEVLMNIWSTRQDREGEAARISLADWKDALKDEDFPRQRIAEVTRALIEAQAVHEAHGFVSPVF